MKINSKNYYKVIAALNIKTLPLALRDAHQIIDDKTEGGTNWKRYATEPGFRRVADLGFEKLAEYLDAKGLLEKDKPKQKAQNKNPYSGISTECRFIERFLTFHNKLIYKRALGAFIDDLQAAMDEKKIRKTSPVAKEIMAVQKAAVKQFNEMYNADHFALKPETIKRFKYIIERYNSLENLDQTFAKSKKKSNGLQGVQQTPAAPIVQEKSAAIMPSEEFASRQFQTIGLKGKWFQLIGDPSPGFKAMVFGMPKMGKSYLCVDFASYLSKNHGKVLYVSKEEFMSPTLALKIKDKDAANPNLDIAGSVPDDLSAYQFVFLDSVSSLKLTPDDLKALEQKYPTISFIYVFQVTKAGSARGTNEFMHNVDVVIEIPERGKAVQFGRFNQGGEMNIFSDDASLKNSEDSLGIEDNSATLFGIKQKAMNEDDPIKQIVAEINIPLEALVMVMVPDDEDEEKILSIIRSGNGHAEEQIQDLCQGEIPDSYSTVKVTRVTFKRTDSDDVSEGMAFYSVTLEGSESELRQVAGEDEMFRYDWSKEEAGFTNSYLKNLRLNENRK